MQFYIPGFMHVMMTSDALEALMHPPKMSCLVHGLQCWTQNFLFRKKGECNLPHRWRAYKYFLTDRTDSDFAFRNLESLMLLCKGSHPGGTWFFLRTHLNILSTCRYIFFSFPPFLWNSQKLATLTGQLLCYRAEL